jgi:hypothetical protein
MDLKPKSFIKRVFDFARTELERRAGQSALAEPPTGNTPESSASASFARELASDVDTARPEPRPSSRPPVGRLEVARNERGALKVRWSVGPGEIERSALLLDEGSVLCLRLVSFDTGRDHVLREVQDRPSVPAQGECDLARPEGRAVIALGLRAGGRFVSIAHHVV